jgi:hypothetical protein
MLNTCWWLHAHVCTFVDVCNVNYSPGGVVLWTSEPPLYQNTRVRIPPEYMFFVQIIATLFFTIYFKCIVCGLKREINSLGQKYKK